MSIIRKDGNKCPICGKKVMLWSPNDTFSYYYCFQCAHCGEFFAGDNWYYDGELRFSAENGEFYDEGKLRSYLFYHRSDVRPFLVSETIFDSLDKKRYPNIYNLTPEMVDVWYPKTFAEKVDNILLKLNEMGGYDGAYVRIGSHVEELFFCQNKHANGVSQGSDKDVQVEYMYKFLEHSGYIELVGSNTVQLTPKSLERIYELQKGRVNAKNVFIAMKFADETLELRSVLKQAIMDAGYFPILMDEIQYNGQIIPEMLYQIRKSKFVIAELSHHSNGAYYEAGYALGQGKEVIHICEEGAMKNKVHFDVKQVNTITYKENCLEELKVNLAKRIQATIK